MMAGCGNAARDRIRTGFCYLASVDVFSSCSGFGHGGLQMSKKVKLEAGQFYRSRGGEICFVVGKSAVFVGGDDCWVVEESHGATETFTEDGFFLSVRSEHHRDLVEHLPGCDGFDWEPPKPQPKYRPFRNAEEFKPHASKLITNKLDEPHYCYVTEFNDKGIWVGSSDEIATYDNAFRNSVFADGTPFGVEVTE